VDPFNACMARRNSKECTPRPGDWVEVQQPGGKRPRCGQIVELLGGPGREHFQVRWDENYESMVFPRPGVRVIRRRGQGAGCGSGDGASASPKVTGP